MLWICAFYKETHGSKFCSDNNVKVPPCCCVVPNHYHVYMIVMEIFILIAAAVLTMVMRPPGEGSGGSYLWDSLEAGASVMAQSPEYHEYNHDKGVSKNCPNDQELLAWESSTA